ncbi:MAG: 3-deoxy-7-phosphoheptulonate synthase, partial [Gammaproteobacteria bacterium]|nr:3-deoxy-7-phosphoheptulonate synthase [Gammaproteobacteria bacterium]
MSVNTDDLRIDSITELLEPDALIREIPPSEQAQRTVNDA